jgi:hypothetical protein
MNSKSRIIILLLLLFFLTGEMQPIHQETIQTTSPKYTYYFPLYFLPTQKVGVEVWPGNPYTIPSTAIVRRAYVSWKSFATDRNNFLKQLDKDLQIPNDVILVFNEAPSYAKPKECSPFYESYLPEFLEFVSFIVNRYHVEYYEIWNEQDSTDGDPKHFGCWGTEYASFYGRVYSSARERIKSIDPNAKVLYCSPILLNSIRGPAPRAIEYLLFLYKLIQVQLFLNKNRIVLLNH